MDIAKIINNNILPYILIIVMGYAWYQHSERQEAIIAQQEADAIRASENLAIVQAYNEARFEELEKVRKEVWNYGKNTGRY